MRAPIRPLTGSWPAGVQARLARFFWPDPRVISSDAATAEEFRTAMSALHVGDTIKITGVGRHPIADALAVDNLDLSAATIVDIGASDGSTSLEFIERLGDFGRYVIADLFFVLSAADVGRHFVLFDPEQHCILVSGPRMVAWPSLSGVVARGYAPLVARARRATRRDVVLLNPEIRALMARDGRVSWQTHDVFTPWPAPAPDLIKVANLLRRLYFSDADILRALRALLTGLDEGGHLLIVDNPRIEGIDCRGGLYKRTGGRFVEVATTPDQPEIADLIASVTIGQGMQPAQPTAPVKRWHSNEGGQREQ